MKSSYEVHEGGLRPCEEGVGLIRVFIAPGKDERKELVEVFGLDGYDLDAALDPDEIPRLEVGTAGTTMIWKQPRNVSVGEQLRFDVGSAGLFLRPGAMLLVTSDDHLPFGEREFRSVRDASDMLLRMLLHTVHHFQGHLKVIKQITAELGTRISVSMENRYYLQMIALSESLIYYIDAIEGNAAVINKLRAAADRLSLTPSQVDTLHDILLDTQQCARQANIYSNVLSGLMDARGNIINNNIGVLLKKLTLISVIFLPLNLLASIGGMSEFSAWTQHLDWRIAYAVFVLVMALIGWSTWMLLTRVLNRRAGDPTRRRGWWRPPGRLRPAP
ncbi:magnesium transporter CorA family protein [Uliginosibacterium sp. H1]|uniref:magnesium transporter CorA family protein n=1 Tax=Uliginosibacterium sp. H1 TaxID=3114757 RepID=UPI002E17E1DA|nr:magnesium transporter CorA family protein [Uliginosibacterium sp. H1]